MAQRASYRRDVSSSFDGAAFGRRIASARASLGLKPKQIAQRVGKSAEAINRWERGALLKPPSKGDLRLLAEALGQSEEWLLEGDSRDNGLLELPASEDPALLEAIEVAVRQLLEWAREDRERLARVERLLEARAAPPSAQTAGGPPPVQPT